MPAQGNLMRSLPRPVEESLKAWGRNLRTARLRRNLSEQVLANRIGVSRKLVADAERGKPSTGAAVYVAMLWGLGLIDGVDRLADPAKDTVGLAHALVHDRTRAGRATGEEYE